MSDGSYCECCGATGAHLHIMIWGEWLCSTCCDQAVEATKESDMAEMRLAEIQVAFSPPLRHLDKIPGMLPDRGAFVYRIRRNGRVHMSGSCQGSAIGLGGAPRALHRGIEAARGAGYTHYVIRGEEHDPIPLAG